MKPSDKETSKSRLQVFLSHSGLCSRRRAMEFIQRGHVTVNGGVVTEPSAIVDAVTDKVYFDGTPVQTKVHEYLLLNKPQGYVTTVKDPHAKKTVLDLLPAQYRHLYPVGRSEE